MSNPIGEALHMLTEAVELAAQRLHTISGGFDEQWQATMNGITEAQGTLGRGPLGEAAMPRLRDAAGTIGPAGATLGRTLAGLGGAVGQAPGLYRGADQDAASTMSAG